MSIYKKSWAMAIPLGWALLFPSALPPQMLPPTGKLVINSDPTGATVTINNQAMAQRTNATFVVSPGVFKVSVSGGSGKLSCPAITLKVSPGQTIERTCPGAGWVSAP